MKTITLNEHTHIPVLGFGTWQIQGKACEDAVREALTIGYRHIDTADAYGNHREVAKGIAASGVPREELFITTKVWNDAHREADAYASGLRFLEELEIPYIDLLLIHWPNKEVPIAETLRGMDKLKQEGKIRAIGVSNFTIHHLQDALATGIAITNNQVEVHPQFNQKELREYCASKSISITAYSPLARGTAVQIPLIKELAEKYSKTPSQIILNWVITRGMITIPKSTTPSRIKENFESLDFQIEEADLSAIDTLPQGDRLGNPSFNEFDY